MKFSGKLLISDIDGTFINDNMEIADRNIDAINYFKENGGLFTFATGRNEVSTPPEIYKHANAPIIFTNGSYIYDFETGRKQNEICVAPGPAISIINTVLGAFSGVGVTILSDNKYYIVGESEYIVPEKLGLTDDSVVHTELANVPTDSWYSVVFYAEPHTLDLVEKFISVKSEDSYFICRSWTSMLEINNARATKGNAALELKRTLELKYKRQLTLCTIGDHGNDVELLHVADLAACPENAIDAVKAKADTVVCCNNDGSIAGFIEYIDANLYLESEE